MRDFGKVSPMFWTGKTGKELRGHPEAQIVALYLMTCPHSNMLGIYQLPKLYLWHETGLSVEGASKGLQRCIDVGFCQYDEESETVFVVEMGAHQVGEVLKPSDLRTKGIHRQYLLYADAPLGRAFFDRYGNDWSLPAKPLASPLEGALKDSEGASKPQSPSPSPSPSLSSSPVVSIPLDDGSEHPVTADDIAEFRSAYPRIDPEAECRKARAWCLGSPANRKTRRGIGKFLNGWMSRADRDAANKSGAGQPAPKTRPLL
jgi:hypothetical protein